MKSSDAILISKKIATEKYPNAHAIFCAGSIIRGEGTETSDIDLVVIFTKLNQARRESFIYNGVPVEAFVHDPETLSYFFKEVDAKSGTPSLPQMVIEGEPVLGDIKDIEIYKNLANEVISQGPPKLSNEDISNYIYGLTDLVDDLKSPRSREEAIGIATKLYGLAGDFALRSNGYWSGEGKQITRALNKMNPTLQTEFTSSFEEFFRENDPKSIFQFIEKLVAPFGGFVFDGYARTAPVSWRLSESKPMTFVQPTLETERLILEPYKESDLDDIFEYASHPDITKYVTWETHQNLEDSKNFFQFVKNTTRTELGRLFFTFAIRSKETKKVLGSIDFKNTHSKGGQIDYVLKVSEWNKGIMSEAASKIRDWAFQTFDDLERIQAFCMVENIGSQRVMEKIGMQKEGLRRKAILVRGTPVDIVDYSIIRGSL